VVAVVIAVLGRDAPDAPPGGMASPLPASANTTPWPPVARTSFEEEPLALDMLLAPDVVVAQVFPVIPSGGGAHPGVPPSTGVEDERDDRGNNELDGTGEEDDMNDVDAPPEPLTSAPGFTLFIWAVACCVCGRSSNNGVLRLPRPAARCFRSYSMTSLTASGISSQDWRLNPDRLSGTAWVSTPEDDPSFQLSYSLELTADVELGRDVE